LIEQSSKSYLESKIISLMEQGTLELTQSLIRDNILVSLKDENGFLQDDQSAISELDEGDDDLPQFLEDERSIRNLNSYAVGPFTGQKMQPSLTPITRVKPHLSMRDVLTPGEVPYAITSTTNANGRSMSMNLATIDSLNRKIVPQKPAVNRNSAFGDNNDTERASSAANEAAHPEHSEYFLEEFGKLKLKYFPDKLGIFSGLNGTTYVLMSMASDLIVFIIQAVFKKNEENQGLRASAAMGPATSAKYAAMTRSPTRNVHPRAESCLPEKDGFDCIENFKMARRCTIKMPFAMP